MSDVAIDAVMTNGGADSANSGLPYAYNVATNTGLSTTGMTVGVGATLLTAILTLNGNAAAPTCFWNGVSMNLAEAGTGAGAGAYVFTLTAPASGNHTLAAAWAGGFKGYLSSISWLNTDTVIGYQPGDSASGYSTATGAQSVPINTGSTGATLCILGNNGGTPAATTGTQIFSSGLGAPNAAASYILGGSGANTHSFNGGGSSSAAAWASIHIIAPSSTASTTGVGFSGSQGTVQLTSIGAIQASGKSGSYGIATGVGLGSGSASLGSGGWSMGVVSLYDASAGAFFSIIGLSGSTGVADPTSTVGTVNAIGIAGSASSAFLLTGNAGPQLVGFSASGGITALITIDPNAIQAKGRGGSLGEVFLLSSIPTPPPSAAALDFPLRDYLMLNTIINPDAQTYVGPEPQPLAPPGFPRWMYNPVLPPVIVVNTAQLNQLIALGTGWSTSYIGPYPVPNSPPASIAAILSSGITDNFLPAGSVPGITSRYELMPTDATSALAGFVAAGDGWMANFINPSTTIPFTLLNNASSTPGNGFILPNSVPLVIPPQGGNWLQWIAAVNGWMVIQ